MEFDDRINVIIDIIERQNNILEQYKTKSHNNLAKIISMKERLNKIILPKRHTHSDEQHGGVVSTNSSNKSFSTHTTLISDSISVTPIHYESLLSSERKSIDDLSDTHKQDIDTNIFANLAMENINDDGILSRDDIQEILNYENV